MSFDLTNGIDIEDVWQGPAACAPLLAAFLSAGRSFDITFTLGVQTHRPDVWLILIELDDERFAIAPKTLLAFGQSIIMSFPAARALGAPEGDIDDMQRFADLLIKTAREALTVSPHGFH